MKVEVGLDEIAVVQHHQVFVFFFVIVEFDLGEWLEAAQDEEGLAADVQAMLARSPSPDAEEVAIHDHEGFGGLEVHEYESLGTVARVAALIEEHGEVFGAPASHFGDLEEAETAMLERYEGSWNSLEDWCESFLDDTGEL